MPWPTFSRLQDRSGALNEQRAQVSVAGAADAAQDRSVEIHVRRIDSLFSLDLASAPIANVCSCFLALFDEIARRVHRCAAFRRKQPELTPASFQIVNPFGISLCSSACR